MYMVNYICIYKETQLKHKLPTYQNLTGRPAASVFAQRCSSAAFVSCAFIPSWTKLKRLKTAIHLSVYIYI